MLKKSTYFEIESKFQSPLRLSELGCLVESGITFFLYQRGQIPLPFDRLQSSFPTKLLPKTVAASRTEGGGRPKKSECDRPAEENVGKTNFEFDGSLLASEAIQSAPISDTISSTNNIDIPEHFDGPERTRFFIRRRKLEQKQRRLLDRQTKAIVNEWSARVVLLEALKHLRAAFTFCKQRKLDRITSIILMFGSSVHTPKEVIIFELDEFLVQSSCEQDEEENEKLSASNYTSEKTTGLIRIFFKSLIMSPEFIDFTAKSLSSTYTHICVQTEGELNEERKGNMILLENFLDPLSRRPRKLLRVKLRSILNENENNANIKRIINNDNVLFDNNSFCCYQIPLRFKGVQCKNKR